MTATTERLIDEIVQLSTSERAWLAQAVLESLEPEDWPARDEAEFAAELNRRFEEIKSGRDVGRPAEVVMRELAEKYP